MEDIIEIPNTSTEQKRSPVRNNFTKRLQNQLRDGIFSFFVQKYWYEKFHFEKVKLNSKLRPFYLLQ